MDVLVQFLQAIFGPATIEFLKGLFALVPVIGFGVPLIAFIVDTAKRFGLQDGWAPLVSGLLNLVLYGIVYFVGQENSDKVETVVNAIYALAPIILGLFINLVLTPKAHTKLAAVGVGYSHSGYPKG